MTPKKDVRSVWWSVATKSMMPGKLRDTEFQYMDRWSAE